MAVYYDKNWSAHKWMMDCNPSEEKKKLSFMRYVDKMLLVKERQNIALKMIESGIEDEVVSEITDFSIDEIQHLKGKKDGEN